MDVGENGGIIDNKTAAAHGISRAMLSKLCAEGKVQRILRGQYIFADDLQDELLSIDKRSPYIIFSHETALFLHGAYLAELDMQLTQPATTSCGGTIFDRGLGAVMTAICASL